MPDIRTLFADYASHHQTKGNKAFHRVGIPLIVLTLLGMLARVPVYGPVTAGILLLAGSGLLYLLLEWRRAPRVVCPSSAPSHLCRGGVPPWADRWPFLL